MLRGSCRRLIGPHPENALCRLVLSHHRGFHVALRPDRKAELFGNLAGDGNCYGLEPVDLAARQAPVVRLGQALALDEQELTVAQDRRAPAPRVAIGCYRSSRPIHFVAEGG